MRSEAEERAQKMWEWVLLGVLLGVLAWVTLFASAEYWLRIVTYYCCLLLAAALSLPFMAPWKTDAANTKLVAWVVRQLCRWMQLSFEFRDFERLEFEGPAVIISNHQSAIDILSVFSRLAPGLVPIIKKELMRLGPFSLCAQCCGCIAIDRSDPKQSHASVAAAVDLAKQRNLKVLVYAEGTRFHAGTGMLPFKKGGFHLAVQGQIPIIPIVYSSYRPFYSKPLRRFRLGGHVIAQVLPHISTRGKTAADVSDLAEQTRNLMLPVLQQVSAEAQQRFHAKTA